MYHWNLFWMFWVQLNYAHLDKKMMWVPVTNKAHQKLFACIECVWLVLGYRRNWSCCQWCKGSLDGSEAVTLSHNKLQQGIYCTGLYLSLCFVWKAKEHLLMEYRYLALRFSDLQNNLRMRSKLLSDMRHFLVHKAQLVDVETPTLFVKTPGVCFHHQVWIGIILWI